MSLPFSDYLILAQQEFRCKGISGYQCPILGRVFDRSGYHILNEKIAVCPSCYAVSKQQQQVQKPTRIDPRIKAKQRIIHFLHSIGWTVGNGEYILPFNDFWKEFYKWSEAQHLFTRKTLVRSIITEMCGTRHDATHLPINPM